MRKIFATVITSLVFSLFILGLSGCGNDYTVIREDPECAEEKEAALEILNEKVPEYYPDIDFSTYFFNAYICNAYLSGERETDLVFASETKADKYTDFDRFMVNIVSKDVYTNFESQPVFDYAEKLVKEHYQIDEDDIMIDIYFQVSVPLFGDHDLPGDRTTVKDLLPLGTVVDEAYITEGLESGYFYMHYSIAVDEDVDLNDMIEKTDLSSLGINKEIIIEQYSHEDFQRYTSQCLYPKCDPIKTVRIECKSSEM